MSGTAAPSTPPARIRPARLVIAAALTAIAAVQAGWAVQALSAEAYGLWAARGAVAAADSGAVRAAFDEALARLPWRSGWWIGRGAADRDAGDFDAAEAACVRAVSLAPHDPEALVQHAESLTELGRYEEAEEAIARSLNIAPNYWRAYYARGFNEGRQSRHDAALAAFERARSLAINVPFDLEAQLARSYLVSGDQVMALRSATRAVDLDERDPEGHRLRGEAYLMIESFAAAEDEFTLALKALQRPGAGRAPSWMWAGAYCGLGKAQLGRHRPREALASYLAAMQYDANYATGQMELAGLEEGLENPSVDERLAVGQLLALSGEDEEAVRVLGEVAPELAGQAATRTATLRARALLRLDRPADALEAIESVEAPAVDLDFTFVRAQCFAATGKPATARLLFDSLLQNPGLSPGARAEVEAQLAALE